MAFGNNRAQAKRGGVSGNGGDRPNGRRRTVYQILAVLRSSSDDERIAVADMDQNFQELAREIAETVEARLRTAFVDSEARIKEHIDKFEDRAEKRMQMHFENLEGTVRLAAEGYGSTLEGIDRKLAEMNTRFDEKFGDHDLVLADHNKRISKLEERA